MSENESEPLLDHASPNPAPGWLQWVNQSRSFARRYTASKWSHYFVIVLTTIDIGCIFADFILSLYLCEHEPTGKQLDQYEPQHRAQKSLETVSLVISCLFMVELLGGLWALGLSFFRSWFRCLDAVVILATFILETGVKDALEEEVGSTIVILRLWRVFQIVEEFGAGAQEQMEGLYERIENLEKENASLRDDIAATRRQSDQGNH